MTRFIGRSPGGQGAAVQALRSSHYRIFTQYLHRDGSTHDLEQAPNATGIVRAPWNAALFSE